MAAQCRIASFAPRLATAMGAWCWAAPALAGDHAAIVVSAVVEARCAVSNLVGGTAADPRAALHGTQVSCSGQVPYTLGAVSATRAFPPQASWTAGADGTVLVTVTY